MKEITIRISDSHYETIKQIAHARGTSVTMVATSATVNTAREFARPLAQIVAELHAKNLDSGEIAGALGILRYQVREELRKLHLVPNPPRPAQRTVTPRTRRTA